MKRNMIFLLVLVVLAILTLSPSLTLYRSNSSLAIYRESPMVMEVVTHPEALMPSGIVAPNLYNIVIHGFESSVTSTGVVGGQAIDVFVTEFTDLGWARFLPIYKPIGFQSTISYRWINPLNRNTPAEKEFMTDKFDIRGHCNIFGMCPAGKAKSMLVKIIHDAANQEIEKTIRMKLALQQ